MLGILGQHALHKNLYENGWDLVRWSNEYPRVLKSWIDLFQYGSIEYYLFLFLIW